MSGPLFGKRILLTRELAPSKRMAHDIKVLDGIPIIIPLMKIVYAEALQVDIQESESFDWVIFSSSNGVKAYMTLLNNKKIVKTRAKIAVVGEKTAQTARDYGLHIDLVPDEYTAEHLAQVLIENETKGASFLLPLGNLAKPYLEEQLQKAGFLVKRINVYQTIINDEVQKELIQLVKKRAADVITFASPSAIQFFLELTKQMDLKGFWDQIVVACIGNVSADYARLNGIDPQIVPTTYTTQGLIQAIAEYYSTS